VLSVGMAAIDAAQTCQTTLPIWNRRSVSPSSLYDQRELGVHPAA
jgi:hypothetical protein